MKSMVDNKLLKVALSAALIILVLPTAGLGQELSLAEPAKPTFNLNARIDDNAQLSREDLSLPGSQSPARDQPFTGSPGEGSEALPMPDMNAGPSRVQTNFPLNAQQEDVVNSQPDNLMTEYGVDWSAWISKLTDRWFFVLKRMEDHSGLIFHTQGPAQIQFTAYPNGQLGGISLKKTSGVEMYDRMQVESLIRSTPAPPFPQGTKRTSFSLVLGWESHPRKPGEQDFVPGSFGRGFPMERVKEWVNSQ
jgi:hypothetical protein